MYRWRVLLLTLLSMSNTINGNNDISPSVIKREGNNESDCFKICKSETLIKCHYYKFEPSSKICLLSESDHPSSSSSNNNPPEFDSTNLKPFLKEKLAFERNELGEIKSLKDQMNELEIKVKNFKQMKADMAKTLQDIEVKNSREGESQHAYLKMKNKMDQLIQLSNLMQNEISKLKSQRATNNRDLRILSQSKRKSDLDLETISNNMDKLQAYLAAARKEDDFNKNELELMKEKQDQMTELMKVLRRKVHSTKSELKSNPLIMKILNNQKMLADGLQDMENKLTVFDKRQVKSDQTYDELYGRVISDEGERKSLANSISSIQKRVKSLQDDIKRIDNPQSSENMERLRTLTTLKNDVAFLRRSNEDLERNIKTSHNELENLIKDIVNIKLSDQSNKAGITAVALAHRHTQQVFDNLNKEQANALNKIHILENVYKRILEVVHNIEVHQVQLKQDISHFDDSINSIGEHLNQKLDDNQGQALADRASSLGEALDKLTSESVSSLSKENLTPIKEEDQTKKAEVKAKFEIKPNKTKPLQEIAKKVNSFVKDREKENKVVEQIQKVNKIRHPGSAAEEQGKAIPNSLSEKIHQIRENITQQLKSKNAEEVMVQHLAQGILLPTTETSINNKLLKKELAKRKSTLLGKQENSKPSTTVNTKFNNLLKKNLENKPSTAYKSISTANKPKT